MYSTSRRAGVDENTKSRGVVAVDDVVFCFGCCLYEEEREQAHRGAAARCGAAGKVCCGKRVRNAVGAAAAAAGVQSCDCCVSSASLPCFCGLYKAIQTPAISLVSYMPLARRSAIARNRQPASLAAPQSEDKRTCVHPLGLEIMEWESEAPAMIEEPVNQSKRRRRWRRSGRCRSSAKR